ncbi:MAG TPA: energy transducer TonB [Rhizomicrobium sp.]|jgi:TonB family protein
MKMKALIAAFVLLPALAAAQITPPALPDGASKPAPSGKPHVCRNYPKAAIHAGAEGTTAIRFRIDEDGSVIDLTVLKSSGNRDLDDATLICASQWRYVPATLNGKPIAVDWQASANWSLHGYVPSLVGTTFTPKPEGDHSCTEHRKADGAAAPGTAILAFVIGTDGMPKDMTVKSSSGDAVFDAYAMRCVAGWRFDPAIKEGKPVDIAWGAEVSWTP